MVNPSLEERMAADPSLREQWLGGIPRGRLGRPGDIEGLAVLLASEEGRGINGQAVNVDGGTLLF